MDKEKLKLFQNAILLLILTVVSSIYLIVMFIYPKASTISSLSADYKAALEKQATMEQKYDAIKASLMQATNVDLSGSKAMYKPMETGLDAESIVAGQFNEILELLRANSIKARSVVIWICS